VGLIREGDQEAKPFQFQKDRSNKKRTSLHKLEKEMDDD
jgi:hypothetical protein